jgi:hypothetical protein
MVSILQVCYLDHTLTDSDITIASISIQQDVCLISLSMWNTPFMDSNGHCEKCLTKIIIIINNTYEGKLSQSAI